MRRYQRVTRVRSGAKAASGISFSNGEPAINQHVITTAAAASSAMKKP